MIILYFYFRSTCNKVLYFKLFLQEKVMSIILKPYSFFFSIFVLNVWSISVDQLTLYLSNISQVSSNFYLCMTFKTFFWQSCWFLSIDATEPLLLVIISFPLQVLYILRSFVLQHFSFCCCLCRLLLPWKNNFLILKSSFLDLV